MSGIEPESERIVPRMSTSIVVGSDSLLAPPPTKEALKLAVQARKPVFRTLNGVGVRHSSFVTPGPTTG